MIYLGYDKCFYLFGINLQSIKYSGKLAGYFKGLRNTNAVPGSDEIISPQVLEFPKTRKMTSDQISSAYPVNYYIFVFDA